MDTFLSNSSASPQFKAAFASIVTGGQHDCIQVENYVPPVKLRRLITQLIATESSLEIERVVVSGTSGCSDFVGSVEVHTASGPEVIDFVWDCRWRAESEGYVDYFGFPDQMRAAQEFDWQCFQRWEKRASN